MEQIKGLAKIIKSAGAKQVLLIGGAVIDRIQNRPVKDWDIEVYGLGYNVIVMALERAGLPAKCVGKEFGVIKTVWEGLDIDINIPRIDNKSGVGHTDFSSVLDPNMTPREAGRRRDLTINSMYEDVETGELIDPFNGLYDLELGIIRATDAHTFREDPLRVYRVMQLLARKGRYVNPDTMDLCRDMVKETKNLSNERVYEEFYKLLMKADKPSIGLGFLRISGLIVNHPELEALYGCYQNPEHHPEGDVWTHTLGVVDMAARIRHTIDEDWQEAFMFGALCHDLGKPSTTDEVGRALGHDMAGKEPCESFMKSLTNNKELIDRVSTITTAHMRCGQLHRDGGGDGAWKRLHNTLRLDVAAAVSYCDSESRYSERTNAEHGPSKIAMEYFADFGTEKIEPLVLGRDLIAAGYTPGRHFGAILERAYALQIDDGMTDKDQILATIA